MKYLFLALFMLGCSGSKLTPQDQGDLASLKAQLLTCDMAFAADVKTDGQLPSLGLAQECKAEVRRLWEAKENERFDGGFSD